MRWVGQAGRALECCRHSLCVVPQPEIQGIQCGWLGWAALRGGWRGARAPALQMERMDKSLESVKRSFATVRTGRANPAMLDRVEVRCA